VGGNLGIEIASPAYAEPALMKMAGRLASFLAMTKTYTLNAARYHARYDSRDTRY